MKFLIIAKQKKNVDTFEGVVAALLEAGHRVTLVVQQRDAERDRRLTDTFPQAGFELAAGPDDRGDAWRTPAALLRSARDWAQYTGPSYRHAGKLHRRAVERLFREIGGSATGEAPAISAAAAARLQQACDHLERAIPSDALHEEFLRRQAPDVVVVTPGLHFGSGQTDVMKSAKALGIPLWMLLFSWDNLSTKGALHVHPDLMFVWNERQRQEAAELHGYPPDRVVIAGAPRFDEFFALESRVDRQAFFAPLGLDPSRPALLYLCSSRFIASDELTYIRTWLGAIRAASPELAACHVLVRPHPDVTLVDGGPEPEVVTWPGMRQVTGWVQRPFDDPGAIVLRTTYRTQEAFYECLHHARAVVALNTSAELEAGIAGRPVYTVLARDAAADGQANTLHFNYLLREHGGFVSYAPDLAAHVAQLARGVASDDGASGDDAADIRSFIMRFLRPLGDQPVAPLLARLLVEHAAASGPARAALESTVEATPERQDGVVAAHTSPAAVVVGDVAIADAEPRSAKPQKTLAVGRADARARVFATAATRRFRRDGVLWLPAELEAWLATAVTPGDVLYDIGAGVGACSVAAAVQRGAAVVAFEPGFTVFKDLCDNVILNGCGRTVAPLPVALGDRAGLLELDYPHEAGGDHHALRDREWRLGRESGDGHYTQPVCAERLDDVVRRHRLPRPDVVRIAVRGAADAVLRGASETLAARPPRSILVSVKDAGQHDAVSREAARLGYTVEATGAPDDAGRALRLTPSNGPRRPRPWAAFRRAARRIRPAG